MLHDELWRANLHLTQSCLAHPFVQALGDGTLKTDLFRAFIAQDAFFLRGFGRAQAASRLCGRTGDRPQRCGPESGLSCLHGFPAAHGLAHVVR